MRAKRQLVAVTVEAEFRLTNRGARSLARALQQIFVETAKAVGGRKVSGYRHTTPRE